LGTTRKLAAGNIATLTWLPIFGKPETLVRPYVVVRCCGNFTKRTIPKIPGRIYVFEIFYDGLWPLPEVKNMFRRAVLTIKSLDDLLKSFE